jgi:hypothetical protein
MGELFPMGDCSPRATVPHCAHLWQPVSISCMPVVYSASAMLELGTVTVGNTCIDSDGTTLLSRPGPDELKAELISWNLSTML